MSRLLLIALAAAFIMAKSGRAAADPQDVHTFNGTLNRALSCKYLLALPTQYEAKSGKRWPVLLFLHGSGERGDDVRSVENHGPPKLLRDGTPTEAAQQLAADFIVVSPQCPKGKWWDHDTLMALLDSIIESHQVDPTRVYLTGLSMGGYGTWDLGLSHPERFAAIAPVCGGGSFATLFLANTHNRAALRSLGVWAFHGAKDPTVPVIESERLIKGLKDAKVADVRLTIYPEAKHNSWTETYSNPELYTWLLSHRREPTRGAK
jgi:predicted peptidase